MGKINSPVTDILLIRRGYENEWNVANPVLCMDELVAVYDSNNNVRYKIGDGITTFKDLQYLENLNTISKFIVLTNKRRKQIVVYLNPMEYINSNNTK